MKVKENLVYLVPLIACGLLNAFGIYFSIETILRQDYVFGFFVLLCEAFILRQTYKVVKIVGKMKRKEKEEKDQLQRRIRNESKM